MASSIQLKDREVTTQDHFDETKPVVHGTRRNQSGQAIIEFTLVFVIFLVISFIPADFGLALFTGQLAQNASREGARIASADLNPTAGTCTMPCTGTTNDILAETAKRMSSALLPGAQISIALSGSCPLRMVTVSVAGNYNYFYYKLMRMVGGSTPDTANIVRTTSMRIEQQGC